MAFVAFDLLKLMAKSDVGEPRTARNREGDHDANDAETNKGCAMTEYMWLAVLIFGGISLLGAAIIVGHRLERAHTDLTALVGLLADGLTREERP